MIANVVGDYEIKQHPTLCSVPQLGRRFLGGGRGHLQRRALRIGVGTHRLVE